MRNKNKLWGLIFILIAVVLVVSKVVDLPSITIGGQVIKFTTGFSIKSIATIILVYISIKGLMKKNVSQMLVPYAIIYWMYYKHFSFLTLKPMLVLAATILVSIGLSMIIDGDGAEFKVSIGKDGKDGDDDDDDDEDEDDRSRVSYSRVFSYGVEYVTSKSIAKANVENIFSTNTVYFTDASMKDNYLVVSGDNVFGTLNLYFPSSWALERHDSSAFGNTSIVGTPSSESGAPLVRLNIDNVFGSTRVYFV